MSYTTRRALKIGAASGVLVGIAAYLIRHELPAALLTGLGGAALGYLAARYLH